MFIHAFMGNLVVGFWFYFECAGRSLPKQPATVKIELRDAACEGVIHTFAESAANDGNESVVPPASISPGTYKIKVSGAVLSNCSESFQIIALPWHVTLPPGPWTAGSSKTITWSTSQPSSVTLSLYLAGSPTTDFVLLKSGVLNDGSETVTVPNLPGSYTFVLMPNSGTFSGYEFRIGGSVQIVN